MKAATDELDFLRLAVIDALLVLQADAARRCPSPSCSPTIGDRAPEAEVVDALEDLKDRALAWGDSALRVSFGCRRRPALASRSGDPGRRLSTPPTRSPGSSTA